MRRDEAIRILTEHHAEIMAFGVTSVSIFGSVARDEGTPESDVDVLIEVLRPLSLYSLGASLEAGG